MAWGSSPASTSVWQFAFARCMSSGDAIGRTVPAFHAPCNDAKTLFQKGPQTLILSPILRDAQYHIMYDVDVFDPSTGQ